MYKGNDVYFLSTACSSTNHHPHVRWGPAAASPPPPPPLSPPPPWSSPAPPRSRPPGTRLSQPAAVSSEHSDLCTGHAIGSCVFQRWAIFLSFSCVTVICSCYTQSCSLRITKTWLTRNPNYNVEVCVLIY